MSMIEAVSAWENVGQCISRRRAWLGLSLDELSSTTGLSVQALQDFEANGGSIPTSVLVRLGVALRTPLDRLLDASD